MRTVLSAVTILFAASTGHAHALDLPKLNTYATAACEKALTLHEAGITNDTIYQVVLCAIWKQSDVITSFTADQITQRGLNLECGHEDAANCNERASSLCKSLDLGFTDAAAWATVEDSADVIKTIVCR